MSRFSGCLLAVLLATPPQATASLVLTPPLQLLERSSEPPDPTPAFGPNLHLTPGEAIDIFRPVPPPGAAPEPLAMGIAVALAAAALLVIPSLRRWALFFRLLD